MTARTTITLDNKNMAFLNKVASKNRSHFINRLIEKEREQALAAMILKANIEEAEDEELWAEMALWECTLSDGLDDDCA